MRILFLLPDFPYPASTGGRLKVFNILKQMSARHQCDILSFGCFTVEHIVGLNALLPNVRVLGDDSPAVGVRKWMGILWNMARGLPPSFASFQTRKYICLLKKILASNTYNVIHYDVVNMAQYLKFGHGVPSVHSPNDATSLIYFRMAENTPWSLAKVKLLISAKLLQRYEQKYYPMFGKVHVVSQDDAAYLEGLGVKIDTQIIPIAVDESFLGKVDFANRRDACFVESPKIVCNGNLGNPAIAKGVLDFMREALPIIIEKWPNARFLVLGQNADGVMQARFKAAPNAELLTWVDDYRAFLADADVVLVPDHVGPPGAKTRTLQAMGLGLPVVGTQTAFAGIPFANRKHGLLYKTMPECAEMINALLSDKKMRKTIGANAHRLIVDEFSLNVIGPKYELMYFDAARNFNAHDSVNG